MSVRLNHTIIAARDRDASATFLTEMLGLPPPSVLGRFAVVRVGDTSLDFMDVREYTSGDEVTSQHYAFLVSEVEFDQIFARVRARGLPYWADPQHQVPGEINTWDDGRGVYFDDPNGHNLEVLTRPYGSAGTSASKPHPLVMRRLEPATASRGNGRERERADVGF